MNRLEADLRILQRPFDLRLLFPDERDGDAAVRADLPRPRHEPRRQVGPLQHALRTHGVLGGEEGDDPTPLQATVPSGSVLRSRAAVVRTASTATSISRSLVSYPHVMRRVPSVALSS